MSRTSGADGPEDVDATFEQIVAELRAEGLGTGSRRDDADNDEEPEHGNSAQTTQQPVTGEPRPSEPGWRSSSTDWEDTMFGADPADDEHYIPPDPPPLPKPRKGAFVVLLFFVAGLLLLIEPSLIGLTSSIATPLGMLALATGIALGLLRVKQGPPDGSDTNGAQV